MRTCTKVDKRIIRHQFMGVQVFSSSCLMLTNHSKLVSRNKNRRYRIFVLHSHGMKEFVAP